MHAVFAGHIAGVSLRRMHCAATRTSLTAFLSFSINQRQY
jgi:hypothetical protein